MFIQDCENLVLCPNSHYLVLCSSGIVKLERKYLLKCFDCQKKKQFLLKIFFTLYNWLYNLNFIFLFYTNSAPVERNKKFLHNVKRIIQTMLYWHLSNVVRQFFVSSLNVLSVLLPRKKMTVRTNINFFKMKVSRFLRFQTNWK